MPSYWFDHHTDDAISDDCFSPFNFNGSDMLLEDDNDRNMWVVLQCQDGEENVELELVNAAKESASREPMCSTPDAKRKKLEVNDKQQTAVRSLGKGHVKRPMNAFMLWSQVERRKIAGTEPNLHNSVISRVLGQRWQKMSHAERHPYIREADRVRQRHQQDHPDYRYCPQRKNKRQQRQDAQSATVSDSSKSQQRWSFRGVGSNKSTVSPASETTCQNQPIRCFRAIIGEGLSSAIDNYSFLSSYPASSSSNDNLRMKLTIDSSFKEKIKLSKSQTTSGVQKLPDNTNTNCFVEESSVQSAVSLVSSDDSGWGSGSNSGSSASDCNTTISDTDLTLDDVLSSLAAHDSNVTLTNEQAEEVVLNDNINAKSQVAPLFVIPEVCTDYQLVYAVSETPDANELNEIDLDCLPGEFNYTLSDADLLCTWQ